MKYLVVFILISFNVVHGVELKDLKRLYSRGQNDLIILNLLEGKVQIDQRITSFFHALIEHEDLSRDEKIEIILKLYSHPEYFKEDLTPSLVVRRTLIRELEKDNEELIAQLERAIANNATPMATDDNLFYFQVANTFLGYCKTSEYNCYDMYLHSLRRSDLMKYTEKSFHFMLENKSARQKTRIHRLLETYLKVFRADSLEQIEDNDYQEKIKLLKNWLSK